MADQLPSIGSGDNGQFTVNMPRSAIQRVDVVDIDLVIQGKGGEKIILPGAALDAMSSRPPAVHFSDGPMGASDLLSSVGRVQVPNTPIPAMASLTQFDQKRTEGRKNLTADGAENPAAQANAAQAAQVAPLQTSGNGSSVEDLLKKVGDLSEEIVKKAFDPVAPQPFRPVDAISDPGRGDLPTFRIPLYVSMVEGNVVGVKTAGATISGAGGADGTTSADGLLPNDGRQYGTETIAGTAGDDIILSDGFSQLANGGNSLATYQALDKETGLAPTGTPFYFAKELTLVAAGYVRSVSSITVSGLPTGVTIEGGTSLGNGTWSLPSDKVFPSPTSLRLVYDVTAIRALFNADSDGDGIKDYLDVQMKVTIEGVGTSAFTTDTIFILRFQDVDAASDVTATSTVPISAVQSSFIYVMPTAGTPQEINAGEGDNLVYGGNSADTITAGAGKDVIYGFGGNDTITAGAGDNTIWGGNGDDTITTGSGNDTLYGGAGNDSISSGSGTDTIDGGAGNNTIVTGDGVKRITAGSGNDSVTVGSTAGTDVIDLGDGANILVATGGANISLTTGSGDDTITTGSGDDSISSGAGTDTIAAGAGNNVIVTGDGVKTITAGSGNDSVTVGSTSGTDVIDLGGGANILVASSGAVVSVGTGSGDDTITTGAGDDSISSGAGADTIAAGAGNNIIVTGDGSKTVTAGAGNDSVTLGSTSGVDVVDLGDGANVLVATGGANVSLTTGSGNDTVTTGSGDDSISVGLGDNIVWAGNGTNQVGGGGGADTLVAGSGTDTLTGGGGADWLYAGTGDGAVNGGANTVDGGAGTDWLSFNGIGSGVTSGTYTLSDWLSHGGADISGVTLSLDSSGGGSATRALGQVDKILGIENIIGSAGDDTFDVSAYTGISHTLYGLGGNDVLIGGNMADTIYGGAGQDSIWGNAGNDLIYLAITGIDGAVVAGTGSDAAGAGTLGYSVTANGVTFSASDIYNIANGGAGADTIYGGDGNDLFISGLNEYSDGTNCDTFIGGAGNDVLDLSAQTIALKVDMNGGYISSGTIDVARFSDIEAILTGSGNDSITGSTGNDTIYAGNGNNSIDASSGNDTIRTGTGNDVINTGAGNDTAWGGAGNDNIYSNGGSDTLYGGAGNDSLISSTTGTDTVTLYGEEDTTGTAGTSYTNTYFLYAATERVYGAVNSIDYIRYDSSPAGQGTAYGVFVNLSDKNYGISNAGVLTEDAASSYWWSGSGWVAMDATWNAANAAKGFYGHAQGDTYESVENILGSSRNDVLIGGGSDNTFYGSLGNDYLYGGGDGGQTVTASAAGALTFSGGDGVDFGGAYSQTVNLDAVSHTLGTITQVANQMTTYSTSLVGVSKIHGIENYLGSSGVDIVWGTDGDNRIDPRYGNDTVFAGDGNDVVYGGLGDAANATTPSGADYLDGGNGVDWISYAGIGGAGATGIGIEAYLADADMNADGANDQIVVGAWAANTGYSRFKVDASSPQIDTLLNFENIQGSGQADILAGNTGANVIFGEAGNDTIYGGGYAAGIVDTLDGGAGTDLLSFYGYGQGVKVDLSSTNGLTILGAAGWSTATLNDGATTVAYIRNFEGVRGTDGADTITGSSGANLIYGMGGDDVIYGGGGADTILGGAGNDTIFLTSAQITAAATLDGGSGTDRVSATDTWSFGTGSFTDAKWVSIEELYARNGAANTAFSLNATNIQAICDSGTSSSLTLYLDTGDRFTVATDAVGTSATYSFTNGGTLAAGSYSVLYKNGATTVATLTLQVA